MVNKPDLLPSAPGNHWLAFIQLFDFEIEHVPAERHKGPDGLSRRRRSIEDSEDSDSSMEADDENKFAKSPGLNLELTTITKECLASEYSYDSQSQIETAKLERPMGECIALETDWVARTELISIAPDNYLAYEGKHHAANQEPNELESPHAHYKPENDSIHTGTLLPHMVCKNTCQSYVVRGHLL